jgi:NAD(P)H-dependent FMN reductase
MSHRILVFYGSYRINRLGIRLADYAVRKLAALGHDVELIDARAVNLPMLGLMYKEHAPGAAPEAMETLAGKIRAADAFVFVVGEYNWGVQPGLKNLTDHYLEEWYFRPAGILSYSAQQAGGARANYAWHATLSEMGMVISSTTVTIGPLAEALDEKGQPIGSGGAYLENRFPKFAADLEWWTEAAKAHRAKAPPPY